MITRKFTQAKHVRVVRDFFESELATQRFEISVIRMRQGQRQIHMAAAAKSDFSFLGDDAFAECS